MFLEQIQRLSIRFTRFCVGSKSAGLPAAAIAIACMCSAAAHGGKPYHWVLPEGEDPPYYHEQPPAGAPWQDGAIPTDVTLQGGDRLFIAIPNIDDPFIEKYISIRISVSNDEPLSRILGGCFWCYNSIGYWGERRLSKGHQDVTDSGFNWVELETWFPGCVEWEYFTIKNRNASPRTLENLQIEVTFDSCEEFMHGGVSVIGSARPACGCPDAPVAVTEVFGYAGTGHIDIFADMTFSAPAGSGEWVGEFVFDAPDGLPRPNGGVRWTTDGPGLGAGEAYSLSFSMLEKAGSVYEVFYFDAMRDLYMSYLRDLRPGISSLSIRPWMPKPKPDDLSIPLNPAALGDLSVDADPSASLMPSVEPRINGIGAIDVGFNRPVVLVDPLAVTVFDAHKNTYIPNAVLLDDAGQRLTLAFDPGSLPFEGVLRMDIAGAVADAADGTSDIRGDTAFSFMILLGDVTGDGRVTEADGDLISLHVGQEVSPEIVHLDLNLDGLITLDDVVIAMSNLGASLVCPGNFPGVVWFEGFENAVAGEGLHGTCNFKGWDNDPTADATVSDALSRNGSNSLEIAGAADLVHEFSGNQIGSWLLSAWQYIPGSFSSGDDDEFAGSYFIMLNTYQDGVHESSDWSVQVQFDSNDGMMKVFHGNGTNTVGVPYSTDRWVSLQVAVDLTNDETRVYYDQQLVATYSWTGGVLGEGGGAAAIAAVNFFANDASAVFYDSLRFEPITSACGDELSSDADGDGLTLLEEFLLGTAPCNADTDGDSVPDGEDNCPLHHNPAQEDSNGNGVGDPCDDTPSVPGDLNGDGVVDVSDLLLLLAAWGACGECPADLNSDGAVDVSDLLMLLANWG